MEAEPINPLDSLLPYIASAIQEWKQKNTEESIKDTVTGLLNKESKQMVLKLLGFTEHWGKWEVDSCNGRSGESAAGDFLRKSQQSAIEDFLKTVPMPVLTKREEAEILKSVKQDYVYQLQRSVRDLVQTKADDDAKELVAELVGSKQLDNYLKVMQLINMKDKNASQN